MTAHDPSESKRVPITAPTAEDVAALGRVAAYLDRAASEVGKRLLARKALDGDAKLLAALRESPLQSAGLCADLLELAAMRASADRGELEIPDPNPDSPFRWSR